MELTEASLEDLQKMISQLEQSLYNHLQWHNALIRTLVCKLPPDRHDISPESYKECRFGQWYYDAPKVFSEHPGFIALGEEHKHMHQLATHLLNNMNHISSHDYDNFANALERMRLEVSALIREVENLLHNRDPLTNAINRVNMLPILREHQEFAKREGQPCCIIMMDLDNFKEINDLYGHATGDLALVRIVRYISQNTRPYDKVFRYGGEEFLLCMPNISVTDAYVFVKRVLEGLSLLDIQIKPNQMIHIKASFGLTLLDPHSPVEQSIDNADKALLSAKTSGKNCIKIWDEKSLQAR